ncbi:MAG: MFS transporter [Eubacterium sp.]|nr:MFS transporter [Eubacterium sp.]
MDETVKVNKIWNPIFISVFVANIAISLGQNMMNTLVPKFADSLGATATVVGVVASMFTITALAVRPFSNPAFDSFSKKKLLILFLADVMISFFIYSSAHSIPVLIVARLMQGAGTGCITPLLLAMAADALPVDKLGSGIGVYMIGGSIAQALGPNIGLNMSAAIGYNRSFLIGAAIMFVGILTCIPMKEVPSKKLPYRISLKNMLAREAIPFSFLMMMMMIAGCSIGSYIAIYAGILGVKNIGLYFTVSAVFLLFVRPIAGKISDTKGFDKVILPGILIYIVAFIMMSKAKTLPQFLLVSLVSALGNGIAYPAIQAVSMKTVPLERRGSGTSTNYIFVDIANLIGPMMAGMLIDNFIARGVPTADAYSNTYRLMIIPLAVAFVFAFKIRKRLVGIDIPVQSIEEDEPSTVETEENE